MKQIVDMSLEAKTASKSRKPRIDLVFHFIDPKVQVELEEGFFDKDSEREVLKTIENIKRSIWIDKTYVGFDDSKYSDVFLTVEGWEALCEMLFLSRFGRLLPSEAQERVVEAYTIMMLCYIYGELKKYGWSYEHIKISPKVSEDIDVEVYVDETSNDSYLDYKGRWQDIEDPEGAREQAEEKKRRSKESLDSEEDGEDGEDHGDLRFL